MTTGIRGITVTGLMRQAAIYNADRPAVIYGNVSLTFAQAWSRGTRMANALLTLGLKPGDRVGVLEDNSLEAQDFFLGAAIAGLVRVPLYARNTIESHEHMLGHTACRAVVVAEKYQAELQGMTERLSELEHLVIRDNGYDEWLAGFSDIDPNISVDPDDWYIIRHTGGTTGKSKGVAYSHRSWLAAGKDWFYNFPPMNAGDVCLHVGPISHGSGYLYTPTWLSGGTNLLLDHFDARETLDVMSKHRAAYMFMVPAMLNAVARMDVARELDFSALKVIQIGGAPIADETALLAREVFGDVLYQGYGQTEALPVCMMGPAEWFGEADGSTPKIGRSRFAIRLSGDQGSG